MQKAIIVDDEKHCIDILEKMLEAHAQNIKILGSFTTIEDAVKAISIHNPDILFLDVQLHDNTCFDLLKRIENIDFDIIFTTAFDRYAIEAFKFSALDYILKPIDPKDLERALEKSLNSYTVKGISQKLNALSQNLLNIGHPLKKLAIPTIDGISLLEIDQVIRCQSDSNYTHIFLRNKNKHTVAKPLKQVEELLVHHNFFRVHQSHLINLDYVSKYYKGKGGYIKMTDGTKIEVAVRRRDELIKNLLGRH
ncbi:MAG: LytTR family DNA-binding domain-containing protein [Leeuwenhoekiella sp.]